MPAIRVAEVPDADTDGRAAFHEVPHRVYAQEPPGTAPRRALIEENLDRTSFASRQRMFVAFRGTEPVGRIVARVAPGVRDASGAPYGMLGFFEAVDDQDVASGMFRAASRWLAEAGAGRIVGPMDGDTWHRYRVNAGPFDRPPFPLEPWNPRYYQRLWESAGFRAIESYCSKWIDDVSLLLPGLEAGVERSRSRGVRLRGLDRSRIAEELALVHEISSEIFADAFLYSPIARDEFLALYRGLESFLDPELVIVAEAPDGQAVGFVFGYADPRLPAVHYKTIGVRHPWRRAAVAAALSHRVYTNALLQRRPQGNHALMRDDNRSQALDQGSGDVFRRYLLYEWSGR